MGVLETKMERSARELSDRLGGGWSLDRLGGGAKNFVYKRSKFGEAPQVLRLSDSPERAKAAAERSAALAGIIPQPRLLGTGSDPVPWMWTEFSEGEDPWRSYGRWPAAARSRLAQEAFEIQNKAAPVLGRGSRFGFLMDKDSGGFGSWREFMEAAFAFRSTKAAAALATAGLSEAPALAGGELGRKLARKGLFDAVEADGFLWDIGDRNLLANPATGEILAVVDLDEAGFGDRLMAPALAWVALEERWGEAPHALDWTKMETESGGPSAQERLEAGKLLYALWFMGQSGTVSASGEACELNLNALSKILEREAQACERNAR